MTGRTGITSPPAHGRRLALVLVYIVIVLTVDTLATHRVRWPVDWTVFSWNVASLWNVAGATSPDWALSPAGKAFDLFKFIFWFVVPFCWCLRGMDWSRFSPLGWKRLDWALLGVLFIAGAIAVGSVRFVPSLRAAYPGMGHLPWDMRLTRGTAMLIWVAAWLPGWEFMHRYFLLHFALKRFPRYGWLLVPLFEVSYHLQKPLLEALGMAGFSLVLTWWCIKRRNLLLPFVAHLYIEVALITLLLFT